MYCHMDNPIHVEPFLAESQQHPSTDGSSTREWVLTGIADSTQLGTRERRRAKERKIQATRTVEATGDGTATEGGIDEENTESGKFLQVIQESVSNGETVDRKLANSMFVGPNGSGKSSLMDRLLKRPRNEFSLSTGVCSPVVMVDIDADNPSTFHSVNVIDSNTWEEVEYDISLVRQMNKVSVTTVPPEHVQPISSEEIAIPPAEIASPPTPPTASSVPESAQIHQMPVHCTGIMSLLFPAYTSSLPASALPHLGQQLDWNDLIEIAHHMLDWEEKLCTHLGLTAVDIHDIKAKRQNNPELQR